MKAYERRLLALLAPAALALTLGTGPCEAQTASTGQRPIKVTVEKTKDGYRLLRGGKPYFVKGGGGSQFLDSLAKAGANSVRTWGHEEAIRALPEAKRRGLSVCFGLWMGHERHGFDYADEKAVAAQRERFRPVIEKYKNDPALLVWQIGNEMEGPDGKNPRIWKAVNDVAKMIKSIDPNHPTMTVIAEIGGDKIKNFKALCPDVDILGVNAYGGMGSLASRLEEQGYDEPFLVTEWGALGPWEGGNAPWGAPIEMTSHEKAEFAIANYYRTVAAHDDRCLGSYVFLWGHKQERTDTWFGLVLATGERTELADAVSRAWTGRAPANRAPVLYRLESENAFLKKVAPGARLSARAVARDPNGDALIARWVVRAETTDAKGGGDAEAAPPDVPGAITKTDGLSAEFTAPAKPGPYRLFVYLTDAKGGAATANIPFFVEEK